MYRTILLVFVTPRSALVEANEQGHEKAIFSNQSDGAAADNTALGQVLGENRYMLMDVEI